MRITRRDLLKGVAAGIAIGCGGPTVAGGDDDDEAPDGGVDPIVTPPEDTPEVAAFALGISAGDLDGERGLVWTHYAGTAPLAAFAWRMDGDAYVEQLGPFAATPSDAGFVHVAIRGLVPGARYRYAFFEHAETVRTGRSRIGSFRTPIASDATEVITFGAIACTDAGRSPDPIQRAAEAATALDAFLLLGDNAYCEATDHAKFRDDYRAHYGRPAHVELRAAAGVMATWDDHEVANDWNPETIDPAQVSAAFETFFEHLPLARPPETPNRIWRSARWGRTVEVFVLDSRSERKPSTRSGPGAQYLSPEQLAWLKAGLVASPARFKLIMNSVPITNMPSVWDLRQNDRWEAYPAQRTELLQFIDDQAIPGIVWLSGDFHLAFVGHVATSGPGANQREILCGPGGQSGNALVTTLRPPQFSFASTTNNFTTLRFDPATGEVRVAYVDGGGTTFHTEAFVV